MPFVGALPRSYHLAILQVLNPFDLPYIILGLHCEQHYRAVVVCNADSANPAAVHLDSLGWAPQLIDC